MNDLRSPAMYRLIFSSQMLEVFTQEMLVRFMEETKCEAVVVTADDPTEQKLMLVVKSEQAIVGLRFLIQREEVDLKGAVQFLMDEAQCESLTEKHSNLGSIIEAVKIYSGCDIKIYCKGEQLHPFFDSPNDCLVEVIGDELQELVCAVEQIDMAIFPLSSHNLLSALFVYLPRDVIPSILSMLPVKPLTKLKMVSKGWYALIESKSFLELHFANSTKIRNIILYGSWNGDFTGAINLRIALDNNEARNLWINHTLPPNMDYWVAHPTRYFRETCSYMGLVCFFGGGQITTEFMISNLSTFKSTRYNIRPWVEEEILGRSLDVSREKDALIGFGYNSNDEDLEIVTMLYIAGGALLILVSVYQQTIQSFMIPSDVSSKHCYPRGVYLNGWIHWLEKTGAGESKAKIISFNLESKEFQDVISLPDYDSLCWPAHLELLDGKLSFVLKRVGDDMNTECIIWSLDKEQFWRQVNLEFIWSYPSATAAGRKTDERPLCLTKVQGLLVHRMEIFGRFIRMGFYRMYDQHGIVVWNINADMPIMYLESLYSAERRAVDYDGFEVEDA